MLFPVCNFGDVGGGGVYKTFAYTGTGSAQSINIGLQPDLVMNKGVAGVDWNIQDSTRGTTKALCTNNGNAEDSGVTQNITAFNGSGFSVGNGSTVNQVAVDYKSFSWKKLANFFDIVSYTGTGAAHTISHSLGVAPTAIIVKERSTTRAWALYSANLDATTPQNYAATWSSAGVTRASSSTYWNNTVPTSSVFSVGTAAETNDNAGTFISYLFAAVASKSAFGTYTGNGSASGPVVSLSFTPTLVMILKQSSSSSVFRMIYGNTASFDLTSPNTASSTNFADLNVADFTIKSTSADVNTNLAIYIYMAFA